MTIVSVTDPAFLTMTYCHVTWPCNIVFLCFLSFYRRKKKEKKNKRNRKINTQKNCIDPESNQEPLDHQSCILPLHWCIRWGITIDRVFLNNGDYLNYNSNSTSYHKVRRNVKHILGQKCVLSYVLWISVVINSFVKRAPDHHLNRELILLPYIYTHAQVIGKLVDSIMNSPVPKKLKGRFTVTDV